MIERAFLSSDKSKRGDTGKYELVLKNAKGEVKVPIDVTVLGKSYSRIEIHLSVSVQIVLVHLKVQ